MRVPGALGTAANLDLGSRAGRELLEACDQTADQPTGAMIEAGFWMARGEYERAIELQPEIGMAHFNRGVLRDQRGDPRGALEDYDRAIELDPNLVNAYHNRGRCYLRLGQHERAIQDYDKVIELDPDSAQAYQSRGRAYEDLREFDRAIEDYSRAIKDRKSTRLNSSHPVVSYAVFCLKKKKKKEDECRLSFDNIRQNA